MGRSPSINIPPPPPPPPSPQRLNPSIRRARQREQTARRGIRGSIFTGPFGVTTQGSSSKATLLGGGSTVGIG
jgi:hypothetical protein